MNETEKERLIKKDIVSIENRVRHAFNQGYEMGLKENKYVEQETKIIMEKIDKFALKQAIESTNKIADHLIVLYPNLFITSDVDQYMNKSEIKDDIKELKYLSYMLSRELLNIIDNEEVEE